MVTHKKISNSRLMLSIVGLFIFSSGIMSCIDDVDNSNEHLATKVKLVEMTAEQKKLVQELPRNVVIAHRGTTYWAPEETEAAMRWARNMGADYLELDLQMTKDGYLIALHDDNFSRTSNVAEKFPGRENQPANTFTLAELMSLDAGSWFNYESPQRARETFVNQGILLFEDVIQIAMGKKIKRKTYPSGEREWDKVANGTDTTYIPLYVEDEADNGNRPGVYPETKEPWQFPGIEAKLKEVLISEKWYGTNLMNVDTIAGGSTMGATKFRVILQTFSKESLTKLHQEFTNPLIPINFLLWLNPDNTSGSEMNNSGPQSYAEWLNYGIRNGAIISGPSISGAPNNYPNLLDPWMADLTRRAGMQIHAYSFDTEEQMNKYSGIWYTSSLGVGKCLTDGWFTNKTGMTMGFFQHVLKEQPQYVISNAGTGFPDNLQINKKMQQYPHNQAEDVLNDLGYTVKASTTTTNN
ncbi:MAG: glycerophosphodiester phosphodiesterase family protein [Marinifilaceae bacterium]